MIRGFSASGGKYLDRIAGEDGVGGDDRQRLVDGLGDENAVERIGVNAREIAHAERVIDGYRQGAKSFSASAAGSTSAAGPGRCSRPTPT